MGNFLLLGTESSPEIRFILVDFILLVLVGNFLLLGTESSPEIRFTAQVEVGRGLGLIYLMALFLSVKIWGTKG